MKILIADDDPKLLSKLTDYLALQRHHVTSCKNFTDTINTLKSDKFHLVITDLMMPNAKGKMNPNAGIEVLEFSKLVHPKTFVILITGINDVPTVVKAVHSGAEADICKPFSFKELNEKISAIELKLNQSQQVYPNQFELVTNFDHLNFNHIIGQSETLQNLIAKIEQISLLDENVLITGETGTGKELFARAIHNLSKRKDKEFIPINCGAIPENLFESELYGHEKGSFTGAIKQHIGKMEMGKEGTIFLDEIGELSLENQTKLLRTIQFRKIHRIGGLKEIPVNFRLISATNRDLEEAIKEKKFREDLFYRINPFQIYIPPLRERKEDIPILISYFINRNENKTGKLVKNISPEVFDFFLKYSWPGNIRELENTILYAQSLSNHGIISTENLPDHLLRKIKTIAIETQSLITTQKQNKLENTTAMIKKTLSNFKGDVQKTAQFLNISDKTLYRKCKKLGIIIKDYRI